MGLPTCGYLGLRGALTGILLIRDRQVVEKIEDCMGNFSVACSFRSVIGNFEWGLQGYMVQMMMLAGNVFGMNWLAL